MPTRKYAGSNFEDSKLNNYDVQQKILQAVREGCNKEVIAARINTNGTTFSHWIALGRRGDPGYAEFYAKILEARKERSADVLPTRTGIRRKWNPEAEQVIISLMRKGTTPRFAAEAAGVTVSTLTDKLKLGGSLIDLEEAGGVLSDEEASLVEFVLEFRRAVADAVNARVELLDRSQNPQWAAWWLERRFPGEWGSNAGASGAERPTKVVLSWGDVVGGSVVSGSVVGGVAGGSMAGNGEAEDEGEQAALA